LFDKTHFVPLIARLPEVVRAGDIATLYWDNSQVQSYSLDAQTLETGWLSFAVPTVLVHPSQGTVYYELRDPESGDTRTSPVRTIRVNLDVPGGLDRDTSTAINEALAPALIHPSPIDSPDTPVTVEVPPWLYMEAGDELTVFWNGIPVKALPLQAVPIEKMLERALKSGVLRRLFRRPLGDVTLESLFAHFSTTIKTLTAINEPQIVRIPKETLIAGGSSEKLPVNYEIRDIVDNYSLLSPATLVDVNIDSNALPAPRLADANPVTNQIDLQVLGAKDALVQVATGALTPGDEVILTWTGRTPTTELSETLPSQTVTAPGFDVLLFNIPNAKVVAFAGGSISAKYTVGIKVSKSANATLSGLVIPLTALELKGAVAGVIDLAVVTGDPLIVSAPAYAGQTAGDRILLSWVGTSATGVPVNYPDEYTVQPGEEAEEIHFEVPRQNLDPLGGGTLQLSYQVVRAGGTQSSPVTTYSVTSASLALPPPNLVESSNGQLAPMRVLNGATVQISYPNPQASDEIALLWNGKNDAAPWQSGAAALTFTVPPSEVGPVIGKTIDVLYAVKRGGVWFTSPVLTVTVLPLMEGDFDMPKVIQATEGKMGVLDLTTFEGDARIVIDPWPFIKLGQKVWLDMLGGAVPLPLLNEHPVAPGEDTGGISSLISRASLEEIPDQSIIEFPAKVQLDGSNSTVGANTFPLLKLQLLQTGRSGFEDFEAYPEGQFPMKFETADIIFTAGSNSYPYVNAIVSSRSGKGLSFHSETKPSEMAFKNTLPSYVTMWIYSIYGADCLVTCYSSEGTSTTTIANGETQNLLFTEKDISRITFRSVQAGPLVGVVLDNIRWSRQALARGI
jgi:hypothetical protein